MPLKFNGIFHYEPIFGQEKLDQIKNNDLKKIKECNRQVIDLICIDTTSQKSFSKKSSQVFLDIIVTEINKRC